MAKENWYYYYSDYHFTYVKKNKNLKTKYKFSMIIFFPYK